MTFHIEISRNYENLRIQSKTHTTTPVRLVKYCPGSLTFKIDANNTILRNTRIIIVVNLADQCLVFSDVKELNDQQNPCSVRCSKNSSQQFICVPCQKQLSKTSSHFGMT